MLRSREPEPGTSVRAGELEPTAPGVQRWQRVDGGPAFAVATETAPGGIVRTDPRATRSIALAPDGTASLRSQRDAADGALMEFAPPLVIAPAVLRAGEEPPSSADVTTVRAGTRDADGSAAKRTVRIASIDRVRTPLGEFDAVRVDAVLTMSLRFASMRRETSTWVRPGDGPVAQRVDERILVMGIVPRNTAETRVRLPDGGTP